MTTFGHPDLTVTWQTSWLWLCSVETLAAGAVAPSGAAGVRSHWAGRPVGQHRWEWCTKQVNILLCCIKDPLCVKACMNDIYKWVSLAGAVWGSWDPTVAGKWGAESMKRFSQSFYCLKENITQYTRALFKVKDAENMFVFPKFRGFWNPFCHFLITTLQVLHELLLLNRFLDYFLKGV